MKLKVNKDICIGCGACQAICDVVFKIEDDGLADVIVDEVPQENEADALDAKDGCPVAAIVDEMDEEED